jgi:heme exporter protein CcmD
MNASLSAWLAMGGYAVFVWGSFAAAAAVYAWLYWAPRAERRRLLDTEEDDT